MTDGNGTDKLLAAAQDILDFASTSYDREAPDYLEMVRKTPGRFVEALKELTQREPFSFTTFPKEKGMDEMIVVTNVQFVSLCAHHLFPFLGIAHLAYIPTDRVAGLSKMIRVVKYYSRGLWIQEKLTDRIADRVEEELRPKGCAVMMTAEHLCYTIRGVQSPGTMTTTSAVRGVFRDPQEAARHEFLEIVKLNSNHG
jgi:GTP cyclohydrolase I